MIVDFQKLFPKSCELKGISHFVVNTDDIKFCVRRMVNGVGFTNEPTNEDIIQVGSTTYKFPAVDNGIMLLQIIATSENMVKLFEKNKALGMPQDKYAMLEINAAMESLNEMALKYS